MAGAGRLEIGRVGAPHGLAGEVRAQLHFPGSNALAEVKRVWLVRDQGEEERSLERAKPHGRGLLLRFEGVADRNAAEKLRGARIEVARDLLPPLAEGEYYLIDLVGMEVYGPDGKLGEVTAVLAHPSTDAIAVRLLDGSSAEQPLLAPWLSRVDVAARRIELASLDGLIT